MGSDLEKAFWESISKVLKLLKLPILEDLYINTFITLIVFKVKQYI